MKEVNPIQTAAIVGNTEIVFALPCEDKEYVFLKTCLCMSTVLRKIRHITQLVDDMYEQNMAAYPSRLRGDALEELSELETMIDFCKQHGYDLIKM